VTNRVIASTVVASLALGSAGCTPRTCTEEGFRSTLGTYGGILFVPALVAYCASRAHEATDETRAAAERTRAAAEKGDAEAQYELGTRYAAGYGDGAQAAKWYQMSADQGFGPAQLRLGVLYEVGFGVVQDNVQADMWYTLAASAEKTTATTTETAITYRNGVEARMTPERIAEARKRAQEWKPS
jgi:TPR repeat protein